MKISVKGIDLDKVFNTLEMVNSKNAIPNNFIYTANGEETVSFFSKEKEILLFEMHKSCLGKWGDLASSYIGIIDKDTKTFQFSVSAPLHTHTEFSILDGANRISDLSKKYEYSGAITDHGVVFGWLEFYNEMKKLHKHPILGCEVYTRNINDEPSKSHLVLLAKNKNGVENLIKISSIAQEHENYGGDFPQKPLVSYDVLETYSKDIICLSACLGGEIPKALENGNDDLAKKIIEEFIGIFGKENFFIEIQRHASNLPTVIKEKYIERVEKRLGMKFNVAKALAKKDKDSFVERFGKYLYQDLFAEDVETKVNEKLIKLAKAYGLKLVATNDAHYLNAEDGITHEALLCNQTGKTIEDINRWTFSGTGYHVHSSEEMEELFADIPEALTNSLEISNQCNFDFEFGNYKLPRFDVPAPFTTESYLRHLCEKGFEERFHGTEYDTNEIKERLNFELDTIIKMGYPSYFLITWDFLKYARDNEIAIGPGRGSAAGSIVSYCLYITDLNPIPYGLLFERFLNPDRISMPDIDIDIQHDRREEVIDYCREKYGTEAVSRIITFGTMAARKVVEDMCRIYNKKGTFEKYNKFSEYIKKAIPNEVNITLPKALDMSPELRDMYEKDADVKFILDESMKLEGLKRNISTHACGIVVSDGDVNRYCPTVSVYDKDSKNWIRTAAFNMNEIESIGLLKMDFLGLKTMTILDDCAKGIAYEECCDFTINDMPLNDVETYIHIGKGETAGAFQLESPGMTSFMKQLFQDVSKRVEMIKKGTLEENIPSAMNEFGNELFERLIAGISLYRPGPMDYIPQYIEGMISGKIIYDHPLLEDILAPTYGVFVYQEQVIQAVQALAGFTKGQADYIRKAMGKKKTAIINEYEPYFIEGSGSILDEHTKQPLNIKGCIANGISRETAKIIYDKMREFGKYAFNKSHAAAYAVNSARTAWCSVHYPILFMKSTLNVFIENVKKVKFYLASIRQKGIRMLPPSVNKSRMGFMLAGNNILFGLKGLKFVSKLSQNVIDEHSRGGNFTSYLDFVERMLKNQSINTRAIQSLIFSGGLDEFAGTRNAKLTILESMIDKIKAGKDFEIRGQQTIFDLDSDLKVLKEDEIPEIKEMPYENLLFKEEEYAGFFISGHPLDDYQSLISVNPEIKPLQEFEAQDETDLELKRVEALSNTNVFVVGILNELETKFTGKGDQMGTFKLQDQTTEIRCVIFPKAFKDFAFNEKSLVSIRGKFVTNDFGSQIIVESIADLKDMANQIKNVEVVAQDIEENAKAQYKQLNAFIAENVGTTKIDFCWNGKSTPKSPINMNYVNLNILQSIFGEKNVHIHV